MFKTNRINKNDVSWDPTSSFVQWEFEVLYQHTKGTGDDIEIAIMRISPKSSAGEDGISAVLLRNCATELKRPLYVLLRVSLDQSFSKWVLRNPRVPQNLAKGSTDFHENYSPI